MCAFSVASMITVVCQSSTRAACEKTAERINVLFGVETPKDPRNVVLDGASWYSHGEGEAVRCGFCPVTLAKVSKCIYNCWEYVLHTVGVHFGTRCNVSYLTLGLSYLILSAFAWLFFWHDYIITFVYRLCYFNYSRSPMFHAHGLTFLVKV